jgi:hypothetical protein
MKSLKIIIPIIILILIVGGIFYLSKKNNWGCALDSQGTRIFIRATDLEPYKNKINFTNERKSEGYLNDWSVINELRNKDITYAEDSNDCYGKHIYKVKTNNQLITVDKNGFGDYLTEDRFNGSFCGNGIVITQYGNSPIFISGRTCQEI